MVGYGRGYDILIDGCRCGRFEVAENLFGIGKGQIADVILCSTGGI